jgi:predicted DsbA family dithiol-disulfide isomerase
MTEGLAIGEREVVEEIASRIGLDNAEVEYVLDTDELADFVRHDEKIAHEQLKVTGVPFFVFDQKLALSGAQPREVFLQALQQAQSASTEQIEQTDAAQCNDEQCEIKH